MIVGQTKVDPQKFITNWELSRRIEGAAFVALAVFATAGSCLTVAWIRANRRYLDAVWPTLMFSGLAALPGLALLAQVVYRVVVGRLGVRLEGSPLYAWPMTLVCGLWIVVGPVLLFMSNGPARPEVPEYPKRLGLVQASHVALWLASSVVAYAFMANG